MSRTDAAFGKAVRDACERNGFLSTRQFQQKTGFNYAVLSKMRNGNVPSAATVVRWAVTVNEPVNKWLRLAGYDLSIAATKVAPQSPVQRPPAESGTSDVSGPVAQSVAIPAALHAAIASAESNAEKVRIAFEYIWLRGDDLGVGAVGSSEGGSNQYQARLQVIRSVEQQLGIRLLPPEVV